MSSDQFERKLQERFAQAEIHPSAALWDRIEADLSPPPKGKKRFLWLWWSLAGLLFLSVGLAWVWQPESGPAANMQAIAAPEAPTTEVAEQPLVLQDPEQQTDEVAPTSTNQTAGVISTDVPSSSSTTASEAQTSSVSLPVSDYIENPPLSDPSTSSQNSEAVAATSENSPTNRPFIPSSSDLTKTVSNWEVESVSSPLLPKNLELGKPEAITPGLVNADFHSPGGKWSFDLSVKSGYALGLSSAFRIDEEKSLSADYAGLANRSSYSGIPTGQVATVLFPRFHHSVSLEAGRTIGTRWRLSLGLEGRAGFGGMTTLGELDQSYDIPPSGIPADPVIVVEQNNINFSSPNQFDHYTVSLPIRLSYLTSLGRGTLEHTAGISINRSWTAISTQNQFESFAFQLSPDGMDLLEGQALPNPVLLSNAWHSDLRLRSRYVFGTRHRLQPFVGAELQTQLQPAFSGDASANQRPILISLELGIRFR